MSVKWVIRVVFWHHAVGAGHNGNFTDNKLSALLLIEFSIQHIFLKITWNLINLYMH